MELTLKNEHCAVTVTDAGAMLRSLVRDGCPRGRLPHLANPAV